MYCDYRVLIQRQTFKKMLHYYITYIFLYAQKTIVCLSQTLLKHILWSHTSMTALQILSCAIFLNIIPLIQSKTVKVPLIRTKNEILANWTPIFSFSFLQTFGFHMYLSGK